MTQTTVKLKNLRVRGDRDRHGDLMKYTKSSGKY
jgi:hypothetical protein